MVAPKWKLSKTRCWEPEHWFCASHYIPFMLSQKLQEIRQINLGTLLLTWINFNSNKDKQSHPDNFRVKKHIHSQTWTAVSIMSLPIYS